MLHGSVDLILGCAVAALVIALIPILVRATTKDTVHTREQWNYSASGPMNQTGSDELLGPAKLSNSDLYPYVTPSQTHSSTDKSSLTSAHADGNSVTPGPAKPDMRTFSTVEISPISVSGPPATFNVEPVALTQAEIMETLSSKQKKVVYHWIHFLRMTGLDEHYPETKTIVIPQSPEEIKRAENRKLSFQRVYDFIREYNLSRN